MWSGLMNAQGAGEGKVVRRQLHIEHGLVLSTVLAFHMLRLITQDCLE